MKESQDETSFGVTPTCEKVEDRIHDLMDLRQPLLSDEVVRQHVSECDACAELVVDFGALNDSLSQIPLATLHRLSGLQLEPEPQRSRRMHPISFVASVACLLLVMLTSGVWFSPSRQPAEVSSVVEDISSDLAVDDAPVAREYISTGPVEGFGLIPGSDVTSYPSDFISAVSFEQISGGVEPFQEYIHMTADLPGLRQVSNSVNATYQIIRVISEKPPTPKNVDPPSSPDVGCHGILLQLCSV